MNRLDLCPLQASYSVQFGCSVQRDQLPGGFSRYSTVTESKKHLVSLAFKVTEMDYLYFRAFYLNWQLNPLPFLMKLFIEDSQYKDYICQFVPDSFNFAELNGRIFNVSAQLLVVISPVIALTSRMYPYRFAESLVTDFVITDVVQREIMNSTDTDVESVGTAFDVSAQITKEIIYRSASLETESLQPSFAVTNAQITKEITYRSTSTATESIQLSFAVSNAQITKEVAYISLSTQVEACSANFAISVQIIEET